MKISVLLWRLPNFTFHRFINEPIIECDKKNQVENAIKLQMTTHLALTASSIIYLISDLQDKGSAQNCFLAFSAANVIGSTTIDAGGA